MSDSPVGAEMVRSLQTSAASASPAEHVDQVEGWQLRHSNGGPWWLGSVLPHEDVGPDELADRVLEVEEFYARHTAPARFQIAPPACPGELDRYLAGRGYRYEGPMSLQVADARHVRAHAERSTLTVRMAGAPTDEWLGVWQSVHGGDDRAEREMLGRIQLPRAYASATIDDDIVAVGRTVIDEGRAGVFSMARLPPARGKGAGLSVLGALADWAITGGSDWLYLQVECNNLPALRLYESAGFGEVCRYHYRVSG